MNENIISKTGQNSKDFPKKTSEEKWTLKVFWQGIKINVIRTQEYFSSFDYNLSHLEVRSDKQEALPMTATGYFSHFCDPEAVESYGGPKEYLLAWLEEAWSSEERKQQVADSKLQRLFTL